MKTMDLNCDSNYGEGGGVYNSNSKKGLLFRAVLTDDT